MGRPKAFDPDAAVATAMDVFWSQGYAGTTPQDLVDRLGIGRGSLYNAFTSKHALYERALRHYEEHVSSRLVRVLEGAGPARARIAAALDLVIESELADPEGRGCMATNALVEFGGRDEAVARVLRRVFDRQEAAFRTAVEQGQRAGEVDADADAAGLARFFVTTLAGMRVHARSSPDAAHLRAVAAAALRAL